MNFAVPISRRTSAESPRHRNLVDNGLRLLCLTIARQRGSQKVSNSQIGRVLQVNGTKQVITFLFSPILNCSPPAAEPTVCYPEPLRVSARARSQLAENSRPCNMPGPS